MNIPLLRDDGTYTTIVAYRCHHKQHKLPLKGGTTISPVLNIHQVEVNAMLKSLQLALL
jgi:glutamate dehydrogenase/leucine dehydrogenase